MRFQQWEFTMYPSIFYYKAKSSESRYTFTPQGQLHVGRLINNQPCWKSLNPTFEEKKKALVLADWAAICWSPRKRDKITRLIHTLLEEGFMLYSWQDGQIIPILKPHPDYGVSHKMTPVSHDKISDAARQQHNLAKDQVHVLDDYWLEALLNQPFEKPRQLSIKSLADIINFSPEGFVISDLFLLLERATPKLQIAHHNNFSESTNSLLYEIKHRLSDLRIETSYNELTLSPVELNELGRQSELNSQGIPLTLDEISGVELLQLLGDNSNPVTVNALYLSRVLERITKLITLYLHDCTIYNDIPQDLPLKSLDWLEAYNTCISTNNLQKIFAQAKRLKFLDLHNIQIIGSLDKQLNLISLYSLNLANSCLNIEQVLFLLASAPNLKRLTLDSGPFIDLNDSRLKNLINQQNIQLDVRDSFQYARTNNLIQNSLPPQQQRQDTTQSIDANTDCAKKEYHLNQLFYCHEANPHPSTYRLSVYHQLTLNPHSVLIDKAFNLTNAENHHLQDCTITRSNHSLSEQFNKDKSLIYAQTDLILKNEWQALPSLSSNEQVLQYHLDDPRVTCEIKYSARDNFYYIRSNDKKPHSVKIEYLLKTTPTKTETAPKNLDDLVARFTNFGVGAHAFEGPGTGQQYLDAINDAGKGACRHRAVALMDAIQNHKIDYALPDSTLCRYVSNDCHAFVEIQLTPSSPWLTYNLGGYAAEVKINSNNRPSKYHFETWRKEKPTIESVDAYCQELVSGIKPKRLIELTSTQHVYVMSLAIETYCHRISRPVFTIHAPEDLVCSAPFVQINDNTGLLVSGPGGSLHDFLTQAHDKANPPVILVNYDHFDADDIVRFNSLLDKEPKADGTLLPDCTLIIGLINPHKPGCYQGEDFYSRFGIGNVEMSPFTTDKLIAQKLVIQDKTNPEDEVFTINLCHARDWKERLLGRWVIKKDRLIFTEGALVQALQSSLPIVLQNGLWDNDSFCHFWQRAQTLGFIERQGQHLDITKTHFLKNQGYDWESLKHLVRFDTTLQDNASALNPTLFSELFTQYQCNNAVAQLDSVAGLIETHKNATLDVNLTRTLKDDEWGELLIACAKHQVALNCHCAPLVKLPKDLGEAPFTHPNNQSAYYVIESNDVDLSIAQLTEKETWKVIDVSELSHTHLLTHISGQLNKERLLFEFTQSQGFLEQALDRGDNVILTGHFSDALADGLAPLLLGRQRVGKLRLVTSDATSLNYLAIEKHFVASEEPFVHVQAKRLRAHDSPWQGLYSLSSGVQLLLLDVQNTKAKAQAFIQQRLDCVHSILDKSPFIFLTGLTGTGKSTFVQKYMISNAELFCGESRITEWAKHTGDKRCILFIDEANITSRQWSEFEGLFNQPASIFIEGKYHLLSPNHKVIFAGNPLNYGGERKIAPLFERHGNALVFEPMSPEFMYEVILQPIFIDTPLENQSLLIAQALLDPYRFLCACSTDEVLISPRELQMMALMILSYADTHAKYDTLSVSRHYAYQLAKNLVPMEHKTAFENLFSDTLPQPLIAVRPKGFVLTPSREPLYHMLHELTSLRKYRRQNRHGNAAQLYGGLGGIIIEGEPGIGKSELVIAQLIAEGFEEARSLDTIPSTKNSFYRMPISMQNEDKERLLLKAFHEGAVVVVDEINSVPMMERLLNELLMGNTPDGKHPQNPGFMVIGTQNPISMAGRHKPSNALKRRLTTVELPPYPREELEQVLIKRGLGKQYTKDIVSDYQKQLAHAKQHQLKPEPSFRDLVQAADRQIKAVDKLLEKESGIIINPRTTNAGFFFTSKSTKTKMGTTNNVENTKINGLSK